MWMRYLFIWGVRLHHYMPTLGFCDRASWANCEERDATIRCLLSALSQHVSGIIISFFRRTKTVCYCMRCAALVLLDVVGNACQTVTFTVLAPYNTAPHNHYQPLPAEPAQHATCSNIRSLFAWRWAWWCPKHVETVLIINIWLLHLVGFLSLFTTCLVPDGLRVRWLTKMSPLCCHKMLETKYPHLQSHFPGEQVAQI